MGTDHTIFPARALRTDGSDSGDRRADGGEPRRLDGETPGRRTGRSPHAAGRASKPGGRSGGGVTEAKPGDRGADGGEAKGAGGNVGHEHGDPCDAAPSRRPGVHLSPAPGDHTSPVQPGPTGAGAEALLDGSAGGVADPRLDSRESKCVAPPLTCDDEEAENAIRRRRRERWEARAALWRASTLPGVRWCGRLPGTGLHDTDEHESVALRRGTNRAGYAGLATCGSVWACPRCSAVIAMERSQEIGRAVEAATAAGGAVYLLTVTMRHHPGHSLAELWDGLATGWREMIGTHEWTGLAARTRKGKNGTKRTVPGVVGDRERFEVAGLVRSLETTYGRPHLGGSGWHLHAHVLVFSTRPMAEAVNAEDAARALGVEVEEVNDALLEMLGTGLFAYRMFGRWIEGVTSTGLPAPTGAGLDIRRVTDDGADYIGRYLAKSTFDVAARIGAEVGGGRNTKVPRRETSVTPFEMLADLTGEESGTDRFGFRVPTASWMLAELPEGGWGVVDCTTGEVLEVHIPGEWGRWVEWEQASKGRRQILWSQRVKKPDTPRALMWNSLLDARGRTATDDEIAAQEITGVTVARIAREAWFSRMTQRPAWLTDLLEVVEDAPDDMTAGVLAVEWGTAHGVEIQAVGN